MRLFPFFCFNVFLVLFAAHSVVAQEKYDGPAFSAREVRSWQFKAEQAVQLYETRYKDLLEALSGRDIIEVNSALRDLRVYYIRKENYTPFSNQVIDKLTEFAYQVDQSSDPSEVARAKLEYDTLLKEHIADLGVLSFAEKMARADYRLGNPADYQMLIGEVLKILNRHGDDGLTPERAYRVLSYGEESYLLARMNVDVRKSELFDVRSLYYNVHYVTDRSGAEYEVFMNVTEAIRNTQIKQYINSKRVTPSDLMIFE